MGSFYLVKRTTSISLTKYYKKMLEDERDGHIERGARIARIIKLLEFVIEGRDIKEYLLQYHGLAGAEKTEINWINELWEDLADMVNQDSFINNPIESVFNNLETGYSDITPELQFLFECMYQLLGTNSCDNEDLHKVFWQYIRIKCEVYRIWIQSNTILGYDMFNQYYNSNISVDNLLDHGMWKEILKHQFQNKYLKKIEFRTTISNTVDDIRSWFRLFIEAYKSIIEKECCELEYNVSKQRNEYVIKRTFPQAAIVYHLIKEDDFYLPEKCWQEARLDVDYGNVEYAKRFLNFYELQTKYIKQIEMLKHVRQEHPFLSKYIVGLDAASGENYTPVWVFAPVYEMARDSQEEDLYHNSDKYGDEKIQSLRFTFHAGKDFRHIISGIRRIDETVEHCKFHAGDRIGHGVALGLEPKEWANKNPMIVIPKVEFLDNLLWAWNLLCNSIDDQRNYQLYMEKKIYDVVREIYVDNEGITVPMLIEAYRMQFFKRLSIENECFCYRKKDLEGVKKDLEEHNKLFCNYVNKGESYTWNMKKIVASRHCKKYLKNMLEPMYYKVTEQEVEIAKAVQKIVRKKISKLGIVVEVNPSSNTCITETDTIFENQAYTLNSLLHSEENVMICVNKDNPSSCATNISNELAYLYYGMIHYGYSKEDALKWLDQLRKNGIESSFIHNHKTKEVVYEEILELARYFDIS